MRAFILSPLKLTTYRNANDVDVFKSLPIKIAESFIWYFAVFQANVPQALHQIAACHGR